LVFDLSGDHRALPAPRPHPPHLGVQAEARLVHEPDLHSAPSLDLKAFQLFGDAAFEGFGRGGIFPGVAGPRNPQHSLSFF
jgi:hypothetical protein